jgi:hypothetical protein
VVVARAHLQGPHSTGGGSVVHARARPRRKEQIGRQAPSLPCGPPPSPWLPLRHPPRVGGSGVLHLSGSSLPFSPRSSGEEAGHARIWQGGSRPCPDPMERRSAAPRSDGHDDRGLDWALWQARLGSLGFFVFFKLIHGGRQLNATTLVNRLTETVGQPPQLRPRLSVTFTPRRLACQLD